MLLKIRPMAVKLRDVLLNRQGSQVIIGVIFLAITVLAGFDSIGRHLEKVIGWLLFELNKELLDSPSYTFERWLVVTVSLTTIWNFYFYGWNFFSAINLFLERDVEVPARNRWILPSALFILSIAAIALGVFIPWWLLYRYFEGQNNIAYLEIATSLLLGLFVIYDLLNWLIGAVLKGKKASTVKREATLLFWRVDIPIAISYLILILFTVYSINPSSLALIYQNWKLGSAMSPSDVSMHATFTFNSFTAGAAAFKLVVSNILFTVLMAELAIGGHETVVRT